MAYLGIDPKAAYSSYRNIDDISASFDGLVTTFPLRVGGIAPPILPINEQQVLINVGGVPQQPDPSGVNGFKLAAGNIIFSSAPSAGETFWGVILASANYISANTRFADGSAGLPSVTFASDVTTGIYSPGAGQLAISTGGTGELFVNVSGIQVPGDVQANSYNGGPLAGLRNAIINGNFDIWQRGTSHSTGGYGSADRWANNISGSTCTMSRQPFTLGQTAVPGEPTYFCRMAVTSVAGAGSLANLQQRIEDVRTFASQQVTVSFWAKADAAKPIAVELIQAFGSGGSPSAPVETIGTTKTTLSTSWQKVTVTATVPSLSGKTIGTDNNNWLQLNIWFDAGSNFNARTDTLGQQSGTFEIAQVQVERGPVATPFERRPIGQELALCQRYYWTGLHAIYSQGAGTVNVMTISYPVTMRAAPTSSWAPSSAVNVAAFTVVNMTSFGARSTVTSGAGSADWLGSIFLAAEL
jgi:hypothetical protein